MHWSVMDLVVILKSHANWYIWSVQLCNSNLATMNYEKIVYKKVIHLPH